MRVNLANGKAELGDAQGDQITGIENLTGSAFNDTLTGDKAANRLQGGSGNDILSGGTGADVIYGGAGIDSLTGGVPGSADGASDLFVFNTALNALANVDTVSIFEASALDKIALDPAVFIAISGGATSGLDLSEFRVGSRSLDADDFIVFDKGSGGSGKLYYDADGDGPGAKVLFAQLAGIIGSLDYTDFTTILPADIWA